MIRPSSVSWFYCEKCRLVELDLGISGTTAASRSSIVTSHQSQMEQAFAQHDDHCPHEGLIYFFSGMLADTILCSDAYDCTIYMYKQRVGSIRGVP